MPRTVLEGCWDTRMVKGFYAMLLGLRINCPRSLTERDILFYWPGESYPEQIYGGNTELIGKWLYVH